jgi:hypothetical protein
LQQAHAVSWWRPAPGVSWQIQLQGRLNTSFALQVYDIDLFDTPQATINRLHTRGSRVICYFNAGAFEEWRQDAGSFPAVVLGKPLDGWAGERWLDVRRLDLLAPIMRARLDLAKTKRCDGVDPDNVDGYANDSGFAIRGAQQLAYNKWLAQEAHARGLAIGLKNDLAQVSALATHFDFAVNEQCVQYRECDLLMPFIDANKAVFGIEYQGEAEKICAEANRRNFDTLIKRLDLRAWRLACR